MATPLPANVNLIQLLAASPGTAIVGSEPLESVQSGTSVAFTLNQVLAFAQTNFSAGNLAAISGLSVLGVVGTANATPAAIAGTTDQVLRIAQNGTTLGFGAINLATAAAVTGILAGANVTSANLASTNVAGGVQGLLPNARLANSTITISGLGVALGGTYAPSRVGKNVSSLGGTSNTATPTMAGINFTVAPAASGNVLINIGGTAENTIQFHGATLQLAYGTGTVPSNGSAAVGTTLGNQFNTISAAAAAQAAFAITQYVTGLSIGTTYWVDIQQLANGTGTASMQSIALTVVET